VEGASVLLRTMSASGMSAIAERAGLGRESLYKALTPGAKPRYDTVLKVLHSLGVKLAVSAVADQAIRHRLIANQLSWASSSGNGMVRPHPAG
jgi:predicted transcriptional regulator